MILLLHISIALTSLAWTTYLYISPTPAKITGAYGLIGGTLASGTLLVITTGSSILQSCVTGLLYLAVVSVGVALANNKLARQEK